MRTARTLARLRAEAGYTLTELLAVMTILLTVLTALTALFVSGAKAELDANRRFQAQQAARVAVDRMRRELHCASGVTVVSAASIVVTLPGYCPSAAGGLPTAVTYATEAVPGEPNRYRLKRGTGVLADHLMSGDVFSYVAPSPASLGRVHLDLRVNVNPSEGWKTWRLETDIALRNTVRG